MPDTRFAAGNYALQLDGASCGFLRSVRGGEISAEVISEADGTSTFARKRIGPPRCEEFEVTAGLGLAKPFYDWIADAFTSGSTRRSGSVVSVNAGMAPVSERQFTDALVTEVTIPALDAGSKEAAYLTVRFLPETVRTVKPGAPLAKPPKATQKAFLASSFRLEIDGLDCKHVSRVDALTIRRPAAVVDAGETRLREIVSRPVEIPDLKVVLAASAAATWDGWFDDFVVRGNNGDAREKQGALVFLAPNRSELGRVVLRNLGIFALRRHEQVAGDERVAKVTAELYCERMELDVPGVAPAAARADTLLEVPLGPQLRPSISRPLQPPR